MAQDGDISNRTPSEGAGSDGPLQPRASDDWTVPGTAEPVPGRVDADSPLLRAVVVIDQALQEAASVSRTAVGAGTLGAALTALTRAQARLDGLVLSVAAEADRAGVGEDTGAVSAAAWWSVESKVTRAAAVSGVRLGTALADRCLLTAESLLAGDLVEAQARVIVAALDDLPADLAPELRERAEKHLVGLAAHHDAAELRILGRKILEVIAPDVAEEEERRRLVDEERRAWDEARLSMSDDGHGVTRGRFAVPTVQAEMLRRQLEALASAQSRRAGQTDPGGVQSGTSGQAARHGEGAGAGRRPLIGDRRRGQAFVEWIERCCAESLPTTGGVNPTVVVALTLDQVTGQGDGAEAAVTLDTGARMSAGQSRRWACEAGLLPAVLGTASTPLDLGRSSRYFSRKQRIALGLRDGGCVAAGCDRPPGMCHAHHLRPWVAGKGPSDLENGRLLCGRHHRLIHDPGYAHETRPDGRIQFARRT